MVRNMLLALLGVASVASVAAVAPTVIPHAYVVEFEANHDYSKFQSQIAGNATTRMNLDFQLFKGASITFVDPATSQAKADDLAHMPGVKAVWPLRVYQRPNPQVIWKGHPSANYANLNKRAAEAPDTFSTHQMTQVDQLRAKGITGKGLKIGVVDTGVDYTHPALGGCFGPGCLVGYGTDLVGDAYTGFNTPQPDKDPMDCAGHGTHVSGIIAAQNNTAFGFTGGAPDVTLGMFRVFGCEGQAGDDVLIAAYNLAYQAGSNVITASIGGSAGWSEEPWGVAVSRIVAQGVPCPVAAGNDGAEGLFFASTAANGKGVSGIGSVDNQVTPTVLSVSNYTVQGGNATNFGWVAGDPANWTDITLPLWAVSFNTTTLTDGCDPLPASTPNLTNYIVLIRRGTCTFVQKVTNAQAKGARFVMLYNNIEGAIGVEADVPGIEGVAMTTPEVGVTWIAALEANKTITLAMQNPLTAPVQLVTQANNQTGGYLSTYTSWGPTWEVDGKPVFSSIGGNVLSTWPVSQGSYAVLSGTSMATPLSAAIFALVGQVRGTWNPNTLESILAAYSHPNLFNDGNSTRSYLAPVPQQGAGLLQAYDAAYATVIPSVSGLSFNDSTHLKSPQNIVFSNLGKSDVTFSVNHVGAATAYFSSTNSSEGQPFPNDLTTEYAKVTFSADKLTVPAGGNATLVVTVIPPAINATRLPVYSGFVALNGSDGTSLNVPYQGVVGSLNSAVTLEAGFLSIANDTATGQPIPIPANSTILLPPPGTANTTHINDTLPQAFFDLYVGSLFVRADVVPLSATNGTTTVLGLATLGNVGGFPSQYNARGLQGGPWNGTTDSGAYVPAGQYKIAFRSLRIFGDQANASDYDVVETLPFTLKYESS